jgi:hypothetical protein
MSTVKKSRCHRLRYVPTGRGQGIGLEVFAVVGDPAEVAAFTADGAAGRDCNQASERTCAAPIHKREPWARITARGGPAAGVLAGPL